MSSTALATQTKKVSDLLASRSGEIAMALPRHLDSDKLIRVVMTSIAKNPKIAQCNLASLYRCVLEVAQVGLYPDGVLGHAYLIPYKDECTLQIGYKGMIDLARRSGQVASIEARVVYEGDEFDFEYGSNAFLKHKPTLTNQGKVKCVYGFAKLTSGEDVFEVMTVEQIEKIRKMSRNSNGSTWVNHWDEMARKTAIRRLFKYLPNSPEMAQAVEIDEASDFGLRQPTTIDVTPRQEPAQQTLEGLIPEAGAQPPRSEPGGEPARKGRITEEEDNEFASEIARWLGAAPEDDRAKILEELGHEDPVQSIRSRDQRERFLDQLAESVEALNSAVPASDTPF